MPRPLPALLQTGTTGETTGVVEGARETQQEAFERLEVAGQLFRSVREYVASTEFLANIIASVVVVLAGVILYEALTRGVPRILRWRRRRTELLDAETVARIKRQDTAIALLRSALRYVIFTIVVLFVLSIFIRDPLPATAGATILAAVLGFGAQSFLRDIIAGFSIVFEGQYSVGDFVEMEPTKVSGIVEELGLRTTRIRALSGELIFIPNGAVTGVTNYVSGRRRFTVEIQLAGAEAASRVLDSLKEAPDLYLSPPHLISREETGGRVRLRIAAAVFPSMDWLVEENLVERIKAAAGEESLMAEPLLYKVNQSNLGRIRDLIPREEG
jgi:small-conductance mechanosensitive channel